MNARAGGVLVLLALLCLVGASPALAGPPVAGPARVATPVRADAAARASAHVRAGSDPSPDGLAPTSIVCLFTSHGACRLHRVVGTIAAWTGLDQCGILSALSELRAQPGLCEFFGDGSGTTRPDDTRRRRDAARTL
jgi:hypothetical protein